MDRSSITISLPGDTVGKGRPDALNNVVVAGLNNALFRDDALVISLQAERRCAPQACVTVTVMSAQMTEGTMLVVPTAA
jgi:hypothetical protein